MSALLRAAQGNGARLCAAQTTHAMVRLAKFVAVFEPVTLCIALDELHVEDLLGNAHGL